MFLAIGFSLLVILLLQNVRMGSGSNEIDQKFDPKVEPAKPLTKLTKGISVYKELDDQLIKNASFSCKSLSKNLSNKQGEWQRSVGMDTRNDLLIEKGYSLDEVTLAIEHYKSFNSARSWRSAQLKKVSKAQEQNRSIRERLESMTGALLPDYMRLRIGYPNDAFDRFVKLSSNEKQTVLENDLPIVDDLVAFIKAKSNWEYQLKFNQKLNSTYDSLVEIESLKEKDLQLMLSYIEYPEEVVGSIDGEAMTLLDYAVRYGYYDLANDILELGVKPTNDWYLRSTLETALLGLKWRMTEGEKIDKLVDVTRKIIAQGGLAKVDEKGENRFYGMLGNNDYDFNKDMITTLLDDHEFDLLAIEGKPLPDKDELKRSIIFSLEQERQAFFSNNFAREDLVLFTKNCPEAVKRLKNMEWMAEL